MIGSELGGRYEIIARIGGGGMAVVYKAYDTLLHRYVAVKVLREQFVHDEEFIQRFLREARSAASLSHPNVVSIYDVGQDKDTHYIVMEYIEGGTLNDIIKERAPLQPEEAVRIASQICDALDHAHQNGIIHRDIKPHNILLSSKNGRVKVTDSGLHARRRLPASRRPGPCSDRCIIFRRNMRRAFSRAKNRTFIPWAPCCIRW